MTENIPTVEQFIGQIDAEEAKSIAKGYTPEHDRERGADHLLNWAMEYARLGKPAASANLIRAARRVLAARPEQELWVQRTGASTVVVRRGLQIVLSLIDDGEVERIGHELLAAATPKQSDIGGDS